MSLKRLSIALPQAAKLQARFFFSVQPFDASEVASVSFSVAGNEIEIDTTAEDGFRVFLEAQDYPDGELELSSVTTGKNGKASTQTITVENIRNPPSTTTVDQDGAVLGALEENGALSTLFVPAGVNEGETVSFTARTRAQVKADTGIDYDALGVTFLGAQQIDSDQALQQTLMVSSGGFGPEVQPGQAVVNYNIAPDADGDGIGELVVVNSASVSPSGDVISDPVEQIQVASSAKMLSAKGSGGQNRARKTVNFSAEPGAIIEFETTGLNIFSPYGNYAFFYSPAADSFAISRGSVFPHPSNPDKQIMRAAVPNLPAGPTELALVNVGSGHVTQMIDFTIQPLHALRGSSARAVYNAYIDRIKSTLIDEGLANSDELLANFDDAQVALNRAYDVLETSDNAAEPLRLLETGARMLENTPIDSISSAVLKISKGCDFPYSSVASLMLSGLSLVVAPEAALLIAGGNLAINIYEMVRAQQISGSSVVAGSADYFGGTLAAAESVAESGIQRELLKSWGTKLGVAGLLYSSYTSTRALMAFSKCQEAEASSPAVGTITGMGSAAPPGGSVAGSVISFLSEVAEAVSFSSARTVALKQKKTSAGRYIIKVLIGGAPRPFAGVTDAGGYFFIPMIPEGEPFVAVATDTQSGEQRALEGVGPPTGESAYLPFDFSTVDTSGALTPVGLNQTVTGALDTADDADLYSFVASAGEEVFFDLQFDLGTGRFVVTDSVGTVIVNTCFRCNIPGRRLLTQGGTYNIVVSGGPAGQYSFRIDDVIRQNFSLSVNDTVTNGVPAPGAGNIETVGDVDTYTFTASPGQEVFFDIQDYDRSWNHMDFNVVDSDGTAIVDTCFECSNLGRRLLTRGGEYTVIVGDPGEPSTGQYSFAIDDVIRQAFSLSINDTVTNGVPAPGAGNIETVGDVDTYTFTASPGQEVFFDIQDYDRSWNLMDFNVVDSDGTAIVDTCFGCSNPGRRLLTRGGEYTVTVGDPSEPSTGQYSFAIDDVIRQTFSLSINDTVTNGVPAPGAGNIETVGDVDTYTFTASPGQEVFFDIQDYDRSWNLMDFNVVDSDGTAIVDTCFGCSNPGRRLLTRGGEYTVTVGDPSEPSTGQYSFHIRAGSQ